MRRGPAAGAARSAHSPIDLTARPSGSRRSHPEGSAMMTRPCWHDPVPRRRTRRRRPWGSGTRRSSGRMGRYGSRRSGRSRSARRPLTRHSMSSKHDPSLRHDVFHRRRRTRRQLLRFRHSADNGPRQTLHRRILILLCLPRRTHSAYWNAVEALDGRGPSSGLHTGGTRTFP